MKNVQSVNPFYANRSRALMTSDRNSPPVVYARLPRAPRNTSPVPHLTSLYHFHRAGEYGDRSYPGNCGGNLIKDLLQYFQPTMMFDPMRGSGTCEAVCNELGIPCFASDIHDDFDACNPQDFDYTETFDLFGLIRLTGGKSSIWTIRVICLELRHSMHFWSVTASLSAIVLVR